MRDDYGYLYVKLDHPQRRGTSLDEASIRRMQLEMAGLQAPPRNPQMRALVFARDKGVCAGCGVDATKAIPKRPSRPNGVGWVADHIVPLAFGGADDLTNIRTLCIDCNWKSELYTKDWVITAKDEDQPGIVEYARCPDPPRLEAVRRREAR